MTAEHFLLEDEAATGRFARALADALQAIPLAEQGFAIHLSGDLGAGKTTLVRHLLAALGIPGPVKSPSYALLEPYNGPSFGVYHFDLYRFSSPDQWTDAGFDEIVAGPGLQVVEWPEQAAGALPPPDLGIILTIPGDGPAVDLPDGSVEGRRVAVASAGTMAGRLCLSAVRSSWSQDGAG